MTAKRMLIVDADPVQSRVLTRTLRQRSFAVTSVRDAEEAMSIAQSEQPDYVILEQELADTSSGLGLIRPLRTLNPQTRILVLTHRASIESAVQSIKLGACNYMAKPAYVEEILQGLGIDPLTVAEHLKHPEPEKVHTLDAVEWKHIRRALMEHQGNVSAAARELRMNRRTLQRKLEAHEAKTGKDMAAEIRAGSDRRRRIELRHRREAATQAPVN